MPIYYGIKRLLVNECTAGVKGKYFQAGGINKKSGRILTAADVRSRR
jgi:hypothetical protein